MPYDVIVVGGANRETIIRHSVHFQVGTAMRATDATTRAGGGGLNQAACLMHFGKRLVFPLLPLAHDPRGEECLASLDRCRTSYMLHKPPAVDPRTVAGPDKTTGESFVIVGRTGTRTIISVPGSVSEDYAERLLPRFSAALTDLARHGCVSIGHVIDTHDSPSASLDKTKQIVRATREISDRQSRPVVHWNMRSAQVSHPICQWTDTVGMVDCIQLTCQNARALIRASQHCGCNICDSFRVPHRQMEVTAQDVVRVVAAMGVPTIISLGLRGSLGIVGPSSERVIMHVPSAYLGNDFVDAVRAGDALAAGFIHARLDQVRRTSPADFGPDEMERALRVGTYWAMAACQAPDPGHDWPRDGMPTSLETTHSMPDARLFPLDFDVSNEDLRFFLRLLD